MYLMKSCEKDFNIKKTKSIRVGTLYGFRVLENHEVRDETEATYDFEIVINDSLLPVEVFLYLFKGAFSNGMDYPFNAVSTPKNLKSAEGELELGTISFNLHDVRVKNSKSLLTSLHHNCFVFCMSLSKDKPENPKFRGYDDFWFFDFEKRILFMNEIKQKIREKISKEKDIIEVNNYNDSLLEVRASQGEVSYKNKFISARDGYEGSLISAIKSLEKISYTKPLKFKNDDEYRFCFEVFYDGVPISITLPFIDIDIGDGIINEIYH